MNFENVGVRNRFYKKYEEKLYRVGKVINW